jgi:hypothetical protein
MACFVVPAAEAVVTTIVTKVVKSKEKKETTSSEKKVPFSHKLSWLNTMLWGGSALLAFEHIWHGEVVPWFPFLTAMSTPESASEMFHEMATNGVFMALLVTAVWGVMVGVSSVLEKKTEGETSGETA